MTHQPSVSELEDALAPLSHGTAALDVLKNALAPLNSSARQEFLNEHLLRAPIYHEDIVGALAKPPEFFHVLQGDVIRTDAAYVLDSRRTGNPTYVIQTSTCDLIPGRRKTVALLQVEAKRTGYAAEAKIRSDLSNLLHFKSTRYLYLPPLPDDDDDVVYNVIHLDEPAQCANEDMAHVERRASMTVIGWRVFGALLRSLQVREASEEAAIRSITSVVHTTTTFSS